ncbi:hypothetical protein D1871_11905 [Nakamurella silvestris]|nr:hypothetical protein D1871_11905 [Nakamurella silvestris]
MTVTPTTEIQAANTSTCDSLAKEAVDISAEKDIRLLKVRSPEVLEDNRASYEKPSGDSTAIVLSCTGTGAWSNATETNVLLELTVDSDGDFFIGYKQQD